MNFINHIIIIATVLTTTLTARDVLLPQRTDIVTGTLPNGLRYVLKSHNEPKNQLSLRMQIATGSLNEGEDQLGIAHFIEHLAFEGSAHFPKKSVISQFESFGMHFGHHQNAATSYEYTTYQLDLPDSTKELTSFGLLFFADILVRLSFDEEAIEDERNTILEEKRLDDMIPGSHQQHEWKNKKYAGSLERKPIGTEKCIRSVKREDFLRYYHAFYRTDKCTIIMVGDMKTDQMQKLVEAHFAPIEPRAQVNDNESPVPLTNTFSAYIEQGAHIKTSSISLSRIIPKLPPAKTIDDFEQEIVQKLAKMMLNSRVDSDIIITRLDDIFNSFECRIKRENRPWNEMVEYLSLRLNQARRYGFSEKELDKAKKKYVSKVMQQATAKEYSNSLADDFIDCINQSKLITSKRELLELYTQVIEDVTLAQINGWWKAFQIKPCIIKLSLPLSVKKVPSESEVISTVKAELKKKISPYIEPMQDEPVTLFKKEPEAGKIKNITHYKESQVTSILLENGVKVHYRKMDMPSDKLQIEVTIAGGKIEESLETHNFTIAAKESYTYETSTLTEDDFDTLRDVNDMHVRLVNAEDYVQLYSTVKQSNFKTLFQLLHVLLRDPQIDKDAFHKWKRNKKKSVQNQVYGLDDYAEQALTNLALKSDESRFRRLMSPTELSHIRHGVCNEWLRRLFTKAPLGVSIIGNIDTEKIVKLAQIYFGTLPAREEISPKVLERHRMLSMKPGPYISHIIRPCETEASFVMSGYSTSTAKSPVIDLLDILIEQRVLARARTDERLIYTVFTDFEDNSEYTNGGHYLIGATCSPENQKQLATCLDEVLSDFKNEGPTEKELSAAKKIANHLDSGEEDDIESLWLDTLSKAFMSDDSATMSMFTTAKKVSPDYDAVGIDDVTLCAQNLFLAENKMELIVEGVLIE